MRDVVFLGTAHPSVDEIPDNAEIWVANEAHRLLPEDRKPSRIFQLHPRDWRETERRYLNGGDLPSHCDPDCFGRNRDHVEYLRTCGVPVYSQTHWLDIPSCIAYPFDEVREEVGISLPPAGTKRLWATSTFGYMAALLVREQIYALEHRLAMDEVIASLQLLGIELPMGTWRERTWEWPNLAYYIGLLRGLGVRILLPSAGSSLLSAPHYALASQPHPGDADHWFTAGHPWIVVNEDDDTIGLGTWAAPQTPVMHASFVAAEAAEEETDEVPV